MKHKTAHRHVAVPATNGCCIDSQTSMREIKELYRSRAFILSLALVYVLVWLIMLGTRTLVPTDEGRYAEMGREMLATGDWITTRLNGIKYFEKPPLQTWMNALTFRMFGLGEWQARLWTGLCGLAGIAMVALTGRKLFGPRAGFLSALVLSSSFYWVALGHINTLDMGLSCMMTLALCGLLIAQRDEATQESRRNWMLVCWAGMALSVLSKGLIGIVLPGAVLVLYTFMSRDWSFWKRLHLGKGVLLFLVITIPWFLLVSIQNPEFPYFFFIHEHFERFLLKNHHREGAWHYFIPLLLLGIMPWLGLLFQGIASGWRRHATMSFQPRQLLMAWAVLIFVFFSFSNSKLPSYILPIFPALALLIGPWMETASRRSWKIASGLIAVIGAVGLPFAFHIDSMAKNPLERPLYAAYQPWVIAAALVLLAGGILTLIFVRLREQNTDKAALALATTGFVFALALMQGHEPIGRNMAGKPLVDAISVELTPTTPLYALGRYEQVLPFYLRRTMTLVETRSEVEYGLQREPWLWIPSRQEFLQKWVSGPKAVAITTLSIYKELEASHVPMHVIARDSRRVVISNEARQ